MARTVMAVIGGFVAMFICVMFVTAIATFAFGLDPSVIQTPPLAYILVNLALSILCAIVGGYTAG